MRKNTWIAAVAAAALALAGQAVAQDDQAGDDQTGEDQAGESSAAESAGTADTVLVELNKLENFEGGCRSFFLFRNRTEITLSAFEMSLAILDRDGVIDRLLTIDAAPLPAVRTTLKIFEIPEIGCAQVGELILHDIAACTSAHDEELDCFGIIELTSRAAPPLVK